MNQVRSITQQNICFFRYLENGDSFGELALLSNGFRAATIKCMTPCYFGVLNKKDFENSIGKIIKKTVEKNVSFLQNCPQFAKWSKNAVQRLLYYLKKESYIKNQIVYSQGQSCNRVYIVTNGEFQLSLSQNIHKPQSFQHKAYTGPEADR